MIKREIVAITKTGGLTRRGNPKEYWIVLECGHIKLTSYLASVHIDEFCFLKGLKPKKRCKDCENNEPVNVKLLGQFTPYKVWKAQNFDRFLTDKKEDLQ